MNQSEIQSLLPEVFLQTLNDEHKNEETILSILIDIMHFMHVETELQFKTIEDFFNPCRTPQEAFIEYLGYWTDLERLWHDDTKLGIHHLIQKECLQELILSASYLSQWRGTLQGLSQFLKIATGSNSITIRDGIDKHGKQQSFHFLVEISEKQKHQNRLIQRIIEQEKPVYVSYDIKFISD